MHVYWYNTNYKNSAIFIMHFIFIEKIRRMKEAKRKADKREKEREIN